MEPRSPGGYGGPPHGARAGRVVAFPPVFLLEKLTQGLKKTRDALLDQVAALAPGRSLVSDDYERLEVALLSADVGPSTTDRILDAVKRRLADRSFHGEPIDALRIEIEALLGTGDHVTGESAPAPPPETRPRPHVTLVVGVNGTGKTTSIAKL